MARTALFLSLRRKGTEGDSLFRANRTAPFISLRLCNALPGR